MDFAGALANVGIVAALTITVIFLYKFNKYATKFIKDRVGKKKPGLASIMILLLKITTSITIIFMVYSIFKTLYPDIALTLTNVTVAAGILGIIFGLAAQSSLGNAIAGMILVFSQAVKVGDMVEYNREVAAVEDIKLTHTILKLRDGRKIAIPNANMLSSNIVNYSIIDELVAASVTVGISYESDLENAIKAMIEAAQEHPKVLEKPPPQVIITGFGDFSINLKLLAWIDDPWIKPLVESDLTWAIYEKFKEYNVEIPYPRRVVIVKSAKEQGKVAETIGKELSLAIGGEVVKEVS